MVGEHFDPSLQEIGAMDATPVEYRRCSRVKWQAGFPAPRCNRVFVVREPKSVSERNGWCPRCIAEMAAVVEVGQAALAAEYTKQCRRDVEGE